PTSDVSSLKQTAPSSLFEGIQLVSFNAPAPASQVADMMLATVNGEPIYESQALPLVEARMRNAEELNSNDPAVRRKQIALELTRLIDWKLIGQQYQNELREAAPGIIPASPSAQEIQAWFESRLHVDAQITSQELFAYYEIHREQFRIASRVRWERMTVKVDECSTHDVAVAIAAYLRNRSLGIAVDPPAEFSRDKIDVHTHGWTEVESVKPSFERSALKHLPIGQVSNTMESDGDLHLLRVLERHEDGYLPLPTVVDRIRNEILSERKRAAEFRLIGLLRSQSQIWTVFDSPIQSNKSNLSLQYVIPASTERQRD
ncbi:MAG: peptidylprolyl isomerase, partial [Pirellula sp.]